MIEISIEKKLNSPFGSMLLQVEQNTSKGEFVAFYGKSGVGKTSTLRILAGLLRPEKGKIIINGNVLLDLDKRIYLPPQKRKIGFVFQDYALFPNMTVFENLSFALQKNQSKKILDELIEIMEIGTLQNQYPSKLSGGQQQRVALARALVQKPELLLLDEPLSALDVELREKLQDYILTVHEEFGLTTILVSHNQAEVLKLADKILVMEEGKINFEGKPIDYFSPRLEENQLQLTGEIIQIKKNQTDLIVTLLIGKDLARIVIEMTEGMNLAKGQKVILSNENNKFTINKIEP